MASVNFMEEEYAEKTAAELRLVLIGMTGSGKSSSGNTILGQKKFQAGFSATSVTRCCQLESAELMVEEGGIQVKRRASVVDGPGFGDTDLSAEEIQNEISKCVSLSAPGPHAFLLVVPVGRYTEHQQQAVITMAKIFGVEAIRNHTLVLFTRGDELEDTTIESFLRQAPESLRELVNRCGGRFHMFNNKDTSSSEQVRVLLQKVDHMVGQRGFYTSAMYQEAEAIIREEEERRMRLRVEVKQRAHCRRAKKRAAVVRSTGVSHALRRELLGGGRGQASHQERSQIRREAALSHYVLDKIKILVSAIATGLVVGATLGALTPLAAAGGAYIAGGLAAGVSVEAAVGTVVAATSGKTAVLFGAAVGGLVGGLVGWNSGAEATSPGEGALEAGKQVGTIGAVAVVVGAGVGCVMGVGAAVGAGAGAGAATAVGGTGAAGIGCAVYSAGSAPTSVGAPAPPAVPPVLNTPPAKSCLAKVANVTKNCMKFLPGSLTVKVQVKKEKTTDNTSSENTTYEFSLDTKDQ